MKKMLFVSGFTPSVFSAGQNYSRNALEDLSSRYQIDVVYFRYKSQDYKPENAHIQVVKAIRQTVVGRVINALLSFVFHPIFTVRFSWRVVFTLKQMVRKNAYDIIYFDFGQVFLYAMFFDSVPKVMMVHDVMYQKFTRDGSRFERFWIFWTERIILNRENARIVTLSEKDRALLFEKYGKTSDVVRVYLASGILSLREGLTSSDHFCFFAAWNRLENYEGLEWFIENVLPFTEKEKFMVIGAYLPEKLVRKIKKSDRITYVGFMDDPYETLARSRALIAPIFKGAGVKVKVLESLACGIPVIGTPVALEGVAAVTPNSLQECRTAEDFKRRITNFVFPTEERMRLRTEFLASYYNHRYPDVV